MSNYPEMVSDGSAKDHDDVVVSDEVVVLLAANKYRKSALIVNVSGGVLRVTTDGSDPTATHGKPVAVGVGLSLTSPCSPLEIKAIRQDTTDVTVNVSEVS